MELKVSSKPGGLSPPDCARDPEKEVSDEDDDDRNHKHRRRETRSQSLERDTCEPAFTRSDKKHNKPFGNGHSVREKDSQGSETWKNYNIAPLDKEINSKADNRRPGITPVSRVNMDLNQRIRLNQSLSGKPAHGRGRGRDSGSWGQHDRFSSVDIASQMVQHGSITPNLFPGRGLPNAPNASWNTFGLIPAILHGGLDALHPIGLQGTLRPAANNPLNIGIPRQRCRDFEEQGFCLRGDMCPMEHGVNRIVVEDVQSLSQFNLPVSLPNAPLVGPAGPGALPSVGAPINLMNSKSHNRSSNAGAVVDDGMFNGAFSGSAAVGGAELYDPDQPLWIHNGPETPNALLALHPSKDDEIDSFTSADTSAHHNSRLHIGADNESALRSTGIPVTSQTANSSVWGRIGAKNKLEKTDLALDNSDYLDNKTKGDQDALAHIQGSSRHGKRTISEDTIPCIVDSSTKAKSDTSRFMRKPSQKAQRTLFVCGIPHKINVTDALLSHFQKFGKVVDIYIPLNKEQAFVQFSKREEAEAALRAPDAVMGNRFIKLWWANRDTIPGDGINNSSNVSSTPRGVAAASVPPRLSTVDKGKDNLLAAVSEGIMAPLSEASPSSSDQLKPAITNGPKAPPRLQKKLELEQLKEELRKKQELLAQKRNDFRRQLDKLEKHGSVVRGEVLSEPAAKRPRVNIASDAAEVTTPGSSNPAVNVQSQHSETIADKNKFLSPKTKTLAAQQEYTGSKQPIRPLAAAGTPFLMNRYKLGNRPTEFRIMPPLPLGLANVDALKEHFSLHGDLSHVELEEIEASDDSDRREVPKICSARITFTTRHSAERAFSNGKCWQGNKLQFVWTTCSTSGAENIPSASKGLVDADSWPAEKLLETDTHEACVPGNEEPETQERNCDAEHASVDKVSEPCPTLVSDEKSSPKFEGSATFLSSKEEAPETECNPAAVSEEKEPSADNAC